MKTISCLVSVLVLSLAACGGDSGVDSSKKLSELSSQESKDACLELVEDFPPRMVTCGGTMITVGTETADCDGEVAPSSCTATVGDARDCAEAFKNQTDEQLCMDGPLPAACMKIVGC
jgi:hypothetical protein